MSGTTNILTPNLAASLFCEILRWDILSDIDMHYMTFSWTLRTHIDIVPSPTSDQ